MLFSQSSIIFSEYVEGSSFNKYIEIYNPSPFPINLDEYNYVFCWNGCDSMQWEFQISFDSGFVLQSNETYVVAHHNADSTILNLANQTTNLLSNGNDVVGLFNIITNSVVDIIGEFSDSAPTNGWAINSLPNATKDHTLIRDPNICNGNFGDWTLSNGTINLPEWIIDSINNFQGIQYHNSICNATNIMEHNYNHKKLRRVVDIFGRESKSNTYQPLFFMYDDGTVEKRIIISD